MALSLLTKKRMTMVGGVLHTTCINMHDGLIEPEMNMPMNQPADGLQHSFNINQGVCNTPQRFKINV